MDEKQMYVQDITDLILNIDPSTIHLPAFNIQDYNEYVDLLHTDENISIVYEGTDCEIDIKQLYEYGDHYIICEIKTYGTDLEVVSLEHNYGNMQRFLNTCITVVHVDSFNEYKYLRGMNNIRTLIKYFDAIYGPEGNTWFLKHCERLWNKCT